MYGYLHIHREHDKEWIKLVLLMWRDSLCWGILFQCRQIDSESLFLLSQARRDKNIMAGRHSDTFLFVPRSWLCWCWIDGREGVLLYLKEEKNPRYTTSNYVSGLRTRGSEVEFSAQVKRRIQRYKFCCCIFKSMGRIPALNKSGYKIRHVCILCVGIYCKWSEPLLVLPIPYPHSCVS